jgi:hypothetical protein
VGVTVYQSAAQPKAQSRKKTCRLSRLTSTSVNDFSVEDFVDGIEVWNVERSHRLDGQRDDFFRWTRSFFTPRLLARGSKRTQNLGTIESLAGTMVAKAHGAIFDQEKPDVLPITVRLKPERIPRGGSPDRVN